MTLLQNGEKNTPPPAPPYGIGLTFRDGHFDTSTMKIGWERANLEKLGRIFLPSGCQDSPCTGDARFPCISVLGQPPSRLAWRKEKPKFVQDFLECAKFDQPRALSTRKPRPAGGSTSTQSEPNHPNHCDSLRLPCCGWLGWEMANPEKTINETLKKIP